MLDVIAHEIQTDHRAGRMLAALVGSSHKGAKVVLTTDLRDADGGSRYHQTFAIRRWVNRAEQTMLTVEVAKSGSWAEGIKPISVMHLNLATATAHESKDSRAQDKLLRYAAEAAVGFAWIGEAGLPTPSNGSVEVVEESTCGHCGKALTDPVSIERGVGPTCLGKSTGTQTILARPKAAA